MKLAIVVDSSSGLTKKQAEERGWHFLPLYFTIDGKEYRDGIDVTPENFLSIYKEDSVAKTSCTPIGEIYELIKKLSEENDFVVIYPISIGLSSQCSNVEVATREFENVFVIKSKYVCQFIVRDLVDLERDVLSNELTVKQAVARIEGRNSSQTDVLLYPKDMGSLVRGGRLSPSAAKLAKLLKIFPVIGLQDGKLEKFDKGVTFNKTFFNTSTDQYKKLSKKKNIALGILDTANQDADKILKELVEKTGHKGAVFRSHIPPIIAIHTGYGAMAVFFIDIDKDFESYNLLNK